MAVFAKFDGVDGESTSSFKFTADSFSFGVEREMKESGEKGGDSGDTFHFKDIQKGGGDGYTEVEWTYADDKGGKGEGYTEVEWTYADRDDADSGALPAEEVTLGYTEVEWTY